MHILTLTTLFPNSRQPLNAVFVRARMEDYTRRFRHRWTVAAPVPWFPRLPFRVNPTYDAFARVPAYEEPFGYPVHHPRYLLFPKAGMRFYGKWMAAGVRSLVRRIHARDPIDVIDGHYIYPDGSAAVELGRELGIPVVLSARGTDLNLYPGLPGIGPLIRKNLAGSRRIVCVCEELRKVALDLGASPDRTHVIGNGVDAERFRFRDPLPPRARLGVPEAALVILSVGHLTERKGFHLLLRAFAALDRADALLVIAGDGPQRQELLELAASLGVDGRVRFPGAVDNAGLPDWYNAADLFVLASSREGWPNVLCEAQASGLPAVATAVWGIPEIIRHDTLGVLVHERTPEGLLAGIREALGRSWDRQAIAAVGCSRTWEAVSGQLESVFQAARAEK